MSCHLDDAQSISSWLLRSVTTSCKTAVLGCPISIPVLHAKMSISSLISRSHVHFLLKFSVIASPPNSQACHIAVEIPFPWALCNVGLFPPLHSRAWRAREGWSADVLFHLVPRQIVPVTFIQHVDWGILLNLLFLRERENYFVGCLVYQISCLETILGLCCASPGPAHAWPCLSHGWWWSGLYSARALGQLC